MRAGLWVIALACCFMASSLASASSRDDVAVEAVLRQFSVALVTGNDDALRHLVADEFMLIEEGHVYDFNSMVTSIHGTLASGTLERTPAGVHTRVNGNIAWSYYHVQGTFKGPDTSLVLRLLETAVLERARGRWRLLLVTSMAESSAP
jgi:hypothetical protein